MWGTTSAKQAQCIGDVHHFDYQEARGFKWDASKERFIPEHGTSKYEIYATSSSSEDYYNKIAAAAASGQVLWEPPDSYLTNNEIKQILREFQGNEVEYYKKVTAAGLMKQKQAFLLS